MVIDWTQAPPWARYHAFDKIGAGYWYENRPEPFVKPWWEATGLIIRSGYTLPSGEDWRESLTKREG